MSGLIFLKPVFKESVWGGSRLRDVFGYDIPSDHTGECWGISAHKNGDCLVDGGRFEGLSLSALWREHPELEFEAILVGDDGRIYVTAGLEGRFALSEDHADREVTVLE